MSAYLSRVGVVPAPVRLHGGKGRISRRLSNRTSLNSTPPALHSALAPRFDSAPVLPVGSC